MTMDTTTAPSVDPAEVEDEGRRWAEGFAALLDSRDPDAADALFQQAGTWRDLLALSWDLRSAVGLEAIREFLISGIKDVGLKSVVIAEGDAPGLLDAGPLGLLIEVPLVLETEHGTARGLARLSRGEQGWAAAMLVTELQELHGDPRFHTEWSDIVDDRFTKSEVGRQNWTDSRDSDRPFPTTAPTVLVIGAGQCGLALAARLGRMGIDNIVVERNDRLGDSWRQRHYNLITHTPSFTDHLPFMPFPENWPLSAPKDKVASWLEGYAGALDIPVWTSTEVVGGSYDSSLGRWVVQVRRSNGQTEELTPTHVVLATGLLSVPSLPPLADREKFDGPIMHSSEYRNAFDLKGKRVVVVGSGASGHDIVQDLHEQGVEDVTMVQRSETYVMSFQNGIPGNYGALYDHTSIGDLDGADLAFNAVPLPAAMEISKIVSPLIGEQDKELLEALDGAGFALNYDGMLANALQSGVGGYYIDQGASQLIIDGSVKLKRGEVKGFAPHEIKFADGSAIDADVVVLCTGYKNMREAARLFGDDVYDRCKDTWILDYDRGGEHMGLWTDSGQQNLWFMAGSLHHARLHSKHLALRLKAELDGIIPA